MEKKRLNEIVNSVYVIPMILDAIERGWDDVEEIGISRAEFTELKRIKHLLEYHLRVVSSSFKPNYPLLRKGLRQYAQTYLEGIFSRFGIRNFHGQFLDYGAGDGYYSELFQQQNPKAKVFMLDRDIGMKIDFEKTPDWYRPYYRFFDLVLLSEVLHCKDEQGREYIIDSIHKVLRQGGELIINENEDPFMDFRLKKITGKEGIGMIRTNEVIQLMNRHGFMIKGFHSVNYHKIYLYEKA